MQEGLVDGQALRRFRTEVGGGFARILSYFREDGAKSVAAIEDAMRRRNSAALVIPAHTLKGEALQFGAQPLGALAEQIETVARRCVETQAGPDALVAEVAKLKPLFERTLALLEQEVNPAAVSQTALRPAFGRRTFGTAVR